MKLGIYQPGTLHDYDVVTQQFVEQSVKFRLANMPFASGSMRHAFFMQIEGTDNRGRGEGGGSEEGDTSEKDNNSLFYR